MTEQTPEARLAGDPISQVLMGDPVYRAKMRELGRRPSEDPADCTCVYSCADDPATACSLSGVWHVHPDTGSGVFGPCPVHPEAPGDL